MLQVDAQFTFTSLQGLVWGSAFTLQIWSFVPKPFFKRESVLTLKTVGGSPTYLTKQTF